MESKRPEMEPVKIKFLSFTKDGSDAEKTEKLQAAAAKIEKAIARQKALNELVDYKAPEIEDQSQIDPNDDNRSLYERLQEQRDKKKEALEESKRLSNLITKLDEEDVGHLNEVSRLRQEEELKRRLEVHDALEAKKNLKRQKILETERQMKESLLGAKFQSAASTSRSSFKKDNKAKSKLLSSIKIRPRAKNIPDSSSSNDNKLDDSCNDRTKRDTE